MPKKRFWMSDTEAVWVIMLLLILIGTVNIFSSSFVKASTDFDNSYYFLNRHLISLAIGLVVMATVSRLNYHVWKRLTPLFVVATVACLIAVALFGIEVNGSKRWIQIGMTFQPSELAKLAAILVVAGYLGPKIDKNLRIKIWSRPWIPILFMGGLVYKQPDLGTAAIIVGLAFFLYILAGMPKEEVLVLSLAAALLSVALTFSASYRIERIWAWFDPWSYESTSGYQTVQSIIAIGSGGLFGVGLGMGTSKFAYLPEAHTDFAFAILCQEMGFVGALLVFILLAGMAWYCGRIARDTKDGFGKLLVIGITILVVGQGVANIAMVSGVLPVIGVPLPFISYGGTSLIVNMLGLGILISVGRYNCSKRSTPPKDRMTILEAEKKRKLKLVRKGA